MMAGTAVAIGGKGLPGLPARGPRTAADYTDNGVTTKSPVEVNRILFRTFPELQSAYAQYPMIFPRWYDPSETTPNGEPCFISVKDVKQTHKPGQLPNASHPIKMDYTYCSDGPLGKGYYFLLCHHAYVSLARRLKSLAPPSKCLFCFGKKKHALDDWFECQRVIQARVECKERPDDRLAAKIQCEKHGKDSKNTRRKASNYDWQKGLQSIQNAANIRAGL